MKIKKVLCSIATVSLFAMLIAGCSSKKTDKKITTSSKITITQSKGSTTKKTTKITTKKTTTQRVTTQKTEEKKEIMFIYGDTNKESLINTAMDAFSVLNNKAKEEISEYEINFLFVVVRKAELLANKVDGEADEIKDELNGLYKTLIDEIDLLKKSSNNLSSAKTIAQEKKDMIKDALENIVNPITFVYINYEYDGFYYTINNSNTIDELNLALDIVGNFAKEYATNILSNENAKTINDYIVEIDTLFEELKNIYPAGLERFENYAKDFKLNFYKSVSLEQINSIINDYNGYKFDLFINNDFDVDYNLSLDVLKEKAKIYMNKEKEKYESYKFDSSLYEQIINCIDKTSNQIDIIPSIDNFKEILSYIKENTINTINNTITSKLSDLKSSLKEQINNKVNALMKLLDDGPIKTNLINEKEIMLDNIDGFTDLINLNEAQSDILNYATDVIDGITNDFIAYLTDSFAEKLEEYTDLIAPHVTDSAIHEEVRSFINKYSVLIGDIKSLDAALDFKNDHMTEMANDFITLVEDVITSAKTKALDIVKEKKNQALEKITDSTLVDKVNTAYNTFTSTLEEIEEDIDTYKEEISNAINTAITSIKKVVAEALYNLRFQAILCAGVVKENSSVDVFSYIPNAMNYTYGPNFATIEDITYDFTNFVGKSEINYGGFGEQWNMVIENLMDCEKMLSVINKSTNLIDNLVLTLVDYYESDTCDDINYIVDYETYYASVNFNSTSDPFVLTLKLKNGITIPLFGEVKPEITYSITSTSTDITIKLSDTNKLRYERIDNNIKLAIEYGIELGSRISYISFMKDGDNITGEIYENLTLKGKELNVSRANFYIDDDYVTVIGNKADGIKGMKGYINELYKKNEGKLLGYEIKETISKVTYNTLWFNLTDISGIFSVKLTDHTDDNDNNKNDNNVYVNGSNFYFSPTWNSVLSVKTSRKYDIEFRTRYFYSFDESTKEYHKHEIVIPMLFIQEGDNYSSFKNDILHDNGIDSEVIMDSNDLNKILYDYDTFIPIFEEGTDKDSSDIIEFIEG